MTDLPQAGEQAASVLARAREARAAAEGCAAEVRRLTEYRQVLVREFEECQAKVVQARESEHASRANAAAVLEKAASEVRKLSKRQLEEVRSLTSPSPVLQRALALVYCVLYPDKALQFKGIEQIPWKQTLAPMLKRDDLVHRLTDLASLESVHPFIAYPAIADVVASNVLLESEASTSPVQRKASKRTSIAEKHAAQLLRVRSARSLDSQPASPSGASGLVLGSESPGGSLRLGSKAARTSVAAALLSDDGRLTLESVEFASSAVAALFKWVLSQLKYARVLQANSSSSLDEDMELLRAEIASLTANETAAKASLDACELQVREAEGAAAAARSKAEALEQEAAAEATAARARQAAAATEVAQRPCEAGATLFTPPEQQEPKLEAVLRRGEVAVAEVEVEIRERINFARGSVAMSSFATRAVQGVVSVMQDNSDIKVCVEGHSRPDEPASVSSQRANAVLNLLVKQGVPRHRLRVAGFGSACTAADEDGQGRVEFSVIQEISVKGTVQFSPRSPALTASSHPLLEKVLALLVARPCLRVRIEGHTDSSPNWGCSNQELSQERAANVAAFLGERGVDLGRLVPVGFGENLPRALNSTSDGKARNRRVEFHILQRETVRDLRCLVQRCGSRGASRGGIDEHGLRQLARTAEGVAVGLSLPIRVAAADLLARLGADWDVQRLLLLATRRNSPQTCALALLPDDCLARVLRFYFLLGCSTLSRET
eukprot:TRINITY_DN5627_c0_g2_i1.p1 TRINITY_DN5627_c0_g2~~TRINITY_DN5627_c0_g2_i1.p1  ORF type:complete len:722 (-),score=150.98 TRINITY_DN5627_c0_g2_i1:204-2369(-)